MKLQCSRVVALIVAFSFPFIAGAQETQPDLVEAKRLYDAAEFQKAVSLLHHAVQALEPQRQIDTARVQLADAYLHLGLAYCAIGNEEAGKDAFRGLLRIDPARRLDDDIYAPKIVGVFERARMSMPAAAEIAAPTAPPLPTRTPPPFRSFGVELSNQSFGLASRSHPHLLFPDPLVNAPGSGITRWSYRPFLYTGRVRADVPLPGRRGQLRVDHWSAESEHFDSDISGFLYPNPASERGYNSSHRIRMESLGVTWSKLHRSSRHLTLRRELGYRFLRVDQDVDDRSQRASGGVFESRTEYLVQSRRRAHGLRAGLDADLWLGGRWYAQVNGGLTLFLAGSDNGRASGFHETPTERIPASRYPSYTSDYTGYQWELATRLRFEMGHGLYLALGYEWQHGLSAGAAAPGSTLNARGTSFALGWRFGAPRSGK
jgi:hypothetical protein